MSQQLSALLALLLKLGGLSLIANEIRGLIVAGPVLLAMYKSGGALMAVYLGLCSLGGIALSVLVPVYIARRLRRTLPDSA